MSLPDCDQRLINILTSEGEVNRADGWLDEDREKIHVNEVWPDIFHSPAGSLFAEPNGIYAFKESLPRIAEVYEADYSMAAYGNTVLSHRMQAVMEKLHLARDPGLVLAVDPVPTVTQKAAETPRAKDPKGHFRSDVELEVLADMNNPLISTETVKQKRQSRPDYEVAYNKLRFEDLNLDAVPSSRPGQAYEAPAKKVAKVGDDIIEFARLFKTTPSRDIRRIDGMIKLGSREYTESEFQSNMDAAVAAGRL